MGDRTSFVGNLAASAFSASFAEACTIPIDTAKVRLQLQGAAAKGGAALVQLMPWAGGGVTDVRPVPGEPDRFTFYLPGSFTWFDVTVDDQDRLIRQRLVNAGHDIRYRFRYGPPDEPPPPADT